MAIKMNGWVFEKAGNLVRVAIRLRHLAALVPEPPREEAALWPETPREELEGKAWEVYWGGVLFTAYASGELPEDLMSTARRAFTEGPTAMEALVHGLQSRLGEHGGWDLPNPVYHHNVVAF